jgi:hypothetical protein
VSHTGSERSPSSWALRRANTEHVAEPDVHGHSEVVNHTKSSALDGSTAIR